MLHFNVLYREAALMCLLSRESGISCPRRRVPYLNVWVEKVMRRPACYCNSGTRGLVQTSDCYNKYGRWFVGSMG